MKVIEIDECSGCPWKKMYFHDDHRGYQSYCGHPDGGDTLLETLAGFPPTCPLEDADAKG